MNGIGTQRDTPPQHIILYDGACALCSHFVQTIIKQDRKYQFSLLALQSPEGRDLLEKHAVPVLFSNPDTFVLLRYMGDARYQVLLRSEAVLFCAVRLKGWYRLLGVVYVVPRVVRDFGYRIISRYRHRFFGGPSCAL